MKQPALFLYSCYTDFKKKELLNVSSPEFCITPWKFECSASAGVSFTVGGKKSKKRFLLLLFFFMTTDGTIALIGFDTHTAFFFCFFFSFICFCFDPYFHTTILGSSIWPGCHIVCSRPWLRKPHRRLSQALALVLTSKVQRERRE